MNDFDPGPGWRAAKATGDYRGVRRLMEVDADGLRVRVWVREEQDLASRLPTEPGYYLAEHPSFGDHVVVELLNSPAGQWVDAGDRQYLTVEEVINLGPLVRLEPRAETAKAVLDRVREAQPWEWGNWVGMRQEFGVES